MATISISRGMTAIVDDDDLERIISNKWTAQLSGCTVYAFRSGPMINGKQKTIRMHRDILGITNPAVHIDHKNGDGLDNRKSNLRIVARSQNGANRRKTKGGTSSRYKGVSWNKKGQVWEVYIGSGTPGRNKYIGSFPTEKLAAQAYDLAAVKQYGEFARLNNSYA